MNEDYVSYELAVKLKACGFDEPCNYGYSVKMCLEPEVSFGEPKMVHSKTPKNYNDNRKGIEKGLEFCCAVPLWLAQKWLRDRCGIHVYPTLESVNEVSYDCHIVHLRKEAFRVNKHYDSYELALSAGIAAALELIKKGE